MDCLIRYRAPIPRRVSFPWDLRAEMLQPAVTSTHSTACLKDTKNTNPSFGTKHETPGPALHLTCWMISECCLTSLRLIFQCARHWSRCWDKGRVLTQVMSLLPFCSRFPPHATTGLSPSGRAMSLFRKV